MPAGNRGAALGGILIAGLSSAFHTNAASAQGSCSRYNVSTVVTAAKWVDGAVYLDEARAEHFSCGDDGSFLSVATPSMAAYHNLDGMFGQSDSVSIVQSIAWQCSDGAASPQQPDFDDIGVADRAAYFNIGFTAVSAEYFASLECDFPRFCYNLGRLYFHGFEYSDDESSTATESSIGPYRGGDYFGYAHHATASSNAMSTCRVNEFATGVTTWYDSAGVTAIRLECAEVVPDTACVPPNLHERKSLANDVLSPAVTREYWEHRRLAHHGEEGEEKKKQSKKSKIMYGFLTAFLIICLFGCFICMMWPPAYPPYEEYADTVYVTSCPSNGRGNTSMPPPTANASISSTPTEGSLRSSPVGVATDAQMDDAVNANPLSRAQRGVARMTRTGVIFLRRARGARSTRGSEDAVNTFGAAVGRGGVEPGSARGREDVEAVSGSDDLPTRREDSHAQANHTRRGEGRTGRSLPVATLVPVVSFDFKS